MTVMTVIAARGPNPGWFNFNSTEYPTCNVEAGTVIAAVGDR
jgi:hypothetical protein